jgi:flagellar motor component MotA
MIWYGIIIGFCAGIVLATLCYTPLVDKVKLLEERMVRDKQLIDEAVSAVQKYERDNAHLVSDLEVMQRMMPKELYAQFYDAPYRDN